MPPTTHLPFLRDVCEFNRAFLALVKARANAELGYLELPLGLHSIIRATSDTLLDKAARVPRALFRLRLEDGVRRPLDQVGPPLVATDLCSLILWSLRHAAQQSGYQARLLFGLDRATVERLGTLNLPEVQRCARSPGVLTCAFADRPWLWRALLTDLRPESRGQLALVALQPNIEQEWPRRRPARPVT